MKTKLAMKVWCASALVLAAPLPTVILPATPAQADTQQGCVKIDVVGGSWRVINNCSHAVIGKFCYENDRYFDCATQSPGGFGPIAPGRFEVVHGKSATGPGGWRVSYCNYADWNAGSCSIDRP